MREDIQRLAEICCDFVMDRFSYSPSVVHAQPKIVAHRGVTGSSLRENTLAALQEAARLGAHGIEFDVRFTRENVPIILHDPSLYRVFKSVHLASELSFVELRAVAPEIPSLEEVLAIRGMHFMIEIKTAMDSAQVGILRELLRPFEAGRDFHFLVLDDRLVRPEFPSSSWILVGDMGIKSLVDVSIARKLGGVAGHYVLMTDRHIARLHEHGQKAGVGFTSSRNLFNREWARGVDWVFTNELAKIVTS